MDDDSEKGIMDIPSNRIENSERYFVGPDAELEGFWIDSEERLPIAEVPEIHRILSGLARGEIHATGFFGLASKDIPDKMAIFGRCESLELDLNRLELYFFENLAEGGVFFLRYWIIVLNIEQAIEELSIEFVGGDIWVLCDLDEIVEDGEIFFSKLLFESFFVFFCLGIEHLFYFCIRPESDFVFFRFFFNFLKCFEISEWESEVRATVPKSDKLLIVILSIDPHVREESIILVARIVIELELHFLSCKHFLGIIRSLYPEVLNALARIESLGRIDPDESDFFLLAIELHDDRIAIHHPENFDTDIFAVWSLLARHDKSLRNTIIP